jgi:hypothetical protein
MPIVSSTKVKPRGRHGAHVRERDFGQWAML